MKKPFITLLSLALLAWSASAQLITAGSTGIAAASETRTYLGQATTNTQIDCTAQQTVAVEVSFAHMGAGTDVCGFAFRPFVNVSSTNEQGSTAFFLCGAANGTTGTTLSTNFNVKGYPFIRLAFITNGVAEVMTNVSVKYWIKRNAP